jgi:tetratricopeptide (TPR) repeat protein
MIRKSPLTGLIAAPVAVMLLCILDASASQPSGDPATADASGYVGNAACAKCHASIYESYARTAMANASGPATENLIVGELRHQPSGVNYRIYSENGKVWLAFERPGDPSVSGKRQLLYYIGQGRRGRTYLFSVDGFVFESPVNWYADRHMWDMAPAYGGTREMPLNLPALVSCLECHVSGIQPPIDGTENRYNIPLFAYSGVTCERCHGPGAAHVNGGGAIVNPAKLLAERRDAVCMQCHLEGNAAIERAGKHLYEYRPGDNLSDYVRYYILTDSKGEGLRATSQFEALSQSVCQKKSGDAMSCTSCHDTHVQVKTEERASFYRAKCLACHGKPFGARHHADRPDCTSCHMPASLSTDVAHTEVTDHRILRRPASTPMLENAFAQPATPKLVPFPPSHESDSDLRDDALAWESVAESGLKSAEAEAERLLRLALLKSSDPALLSAMGYIEQKQGATDRARELYQRALAIDPNLIDAATNLGVLEAKSGHMREAVTLWQGSFQRAPGRSSIGMNLARTFCGSGQVDEARTYTLRVLQFNPDLGAAKKLLNGLNADPPKCGL